jgi:hypothetical protein
MRGTQRPPLPRTGGGTNFNISDTDGSASGNLPNDIATYGSGSTEMTGASGVESFNVQVTGQWTIKVVSRRESCRAGLTWGLT